MQCGECRIGTDIIVICAFSELTPNRIQRDNNRESSNYEKQQR